MAGMNLSDLDFSEFDFADEEVSAKKNNVHIDAKQLSVEDFDRIEGAIDGDPNLAWFDGDKIPEEWRDLASRSEENYIDVAHEIVEASTDQLNDQNTSKAKLKKTLCIFFMIFISVQYAALLAIFGLQIAQVGVPLPNDIIIAYITSIFVETLGAIILMIKYAFDSKQEIQVLKILEGIITNYQKFNGYISPSNKK